MKPFRQHFPIVALVTALFAARPLWSLLRPVAGSVAAGACAQLWVLTVSTIAFCRAPRPPRLLPDSPSSRDRRRLLLHRLIVGGTAGIGLFVVSGVGYAVTRHLGVTNGATEALVPTRPLDWGLAILTVVAAGIGEEIAFRGLLLDALLPTGRPGAVVISSLLFAAYHLSALQLLSTALLGVGLSLLTLRQGDRLGAMTAHLTHNALGLLLLASGAVS